jgi:four helix bundle protein
MGSASELDCHLLLARDLGLLENPAYQDLFKQLSEVQLMLAALIRQPDGSRENDVNSRTRSRGATS